MHICMHAMVILYASHPPSQETDRNMEEMWRALQDGGRCPVAELVCNHRSFAQTVENMFTLSFLVG